MRVQAAKTIPVAQAKTHFLSLVSEVTEKGATHVITKRGRVVAHIVPPPKKKPLITPLRGAGKGYLRITGDIISSAADEDDWAVFRE
jgi:antitoxin (DNA-binding transcriptional repressor) of toxin-antitoxin stability system